MNNMSGFNDSDWNLTQVDHSLSYFVSIFCLILFIISFILNTIIIIVFIRNKDELLKNVNLLTFALIITCLIGTLIELPLISSTSLIVSK